MEHRTMNTIVHAAVRRDIGRLQSALESFPIGSRARAGQLERAWRNLESELRHHHDSEEELFWPAVEELGFDEALMTELGGEHELMIAAVGNVNAAMHDLEGDASTEMVSAARRSVDALKDTVVRHLEHEESALEPFVADNMDTPPLKKAQAAVARANIGHLGSFFAWLQDGADAGTRAALRKEVPAPVIAIATTVFGRGYRKNVASVWT